MISYMTRKTRYKVYHKYNNNNNFVETAGVEFAGGEQARQRRTIFTRLRRAAFEDVVRLIAYVPVLISEISLFCVPRCSYGNAPHEVM